MKRTRKIRKKTRKASKQASKQTNRQTEQIRKLKNIIESSRDKTRLDG